MYPFARLTFVTRLALWCVFTPLLGFAAPPEIAPVLKAMETRYNRVQSLRLDFAETYTASRRPAQNEAGVLYLRKPGRMRWEYSAPPGKVFLSDGKDVYLYVPQEGRAEKSKLRESDDMRAPLAFLLGRLDFDKEFQSFHLKPEGGDVWIVAEPKSRNAAYTSVEFLASPTGEIHRVRVTGQDSSKLEFAFSHEQLNAPVAGSLFVFTPPAGVRLEEAQQ